MHKRISLGVIGGDGIGPEVAEEAIETIRAVSQGLLDIEVVEYSLGASHYLETGEILSVDTLGRLSAHDAILLGAVGGDPRDPRLEGGLIERGLLLKLRFAFDHCVNLRPTLLLPGIESPLSNPGAIDFVVVREGTEGPYAGNGGSLRTGTLEEIATEVSLNTAYGVSRVVRFAFEKAATRKKKLTLVHKTNVLAHAGTLWSRIVREVQTEYSDIEVDYLHVDAATIFLVNDPSRFDVIVTDNLFGDIITDLAGAISGGIGLASSANINLEGSFPSMFEPVHGSAPDIAGTGKADPTAAIVSGAMLLDHLGFAGLAGRIVNAVAQDVSSRKTRGARSTSQIGDEIRSWI